MGEGSLSLCISSILHIVYCFYGCHSRGSGTSQLLILSPCLLAICVFSLANDVFISSPYVLLGVPDILLWSHWGVIEFHCISLTWHLIYYHFLSLCCFMFFKVYVFYEFYLYVCKCTAWVCTSGSQKRALASLELELWTIVSHHVGAGNWIWVLS